ncbi:unnamed protein product [Caenorhabditis auriculariae]|uniref:C2H2-type domain-containing protein n=1 Tax=Caenorhabditis auriculariae TaxID=2777116 RepID=A0A8S1HV48_9PELO|nr:unnamed protein product [Caenorhabditis auriculariae]
MRRCNFSSNDELIIMNHVCTFHAGQPLPPNLIFSHIDANCTGGDWESPLRQHLVCPPQTPPTSTTASNPEAQVCSRPFCKLKKKSHFHCKYCDQGFSNPSKLLHHAQRHKFGVELFLDGSKGKFRPARSSPLDVGVV